MSLSEEETAFLALAIDTLLCEDGPRSASWLDGAWNGLPFLDALPGWIRGAVEWTARSGRPRLSRVLEVGLSEGWLSGSLSELSVTPEGREWAMQQYAGWGRTRFQDLIYVAVELCGLLDRYGPSTTESLASRLVVTTTAMGNPGHEAMRRGEEEYALEAARAALAQASEVGWVSAAGDRWQLTEMGRSEGLRYYDGMR